MSVSFAVTAFRESTRDDGERLLRCLEPARAHPGIHEVVVVDDGSDDYGWLSGLLGSALKVAIYHNPENQGVFGNKIEAVARSTGDWVITCDSDNLMRADFIDKILSLDKLPHTWYCPSFARPKFDYRRLIGDYDLAGLERILDEPMFQCACNTGNQTVHRKCFMDTFQKYRGRRADLMMPNWLNIPEAERSTHHWRLVFDALDSFILNWTWLQDEGRLHIVDGLEYDHYWSGGDDSNYARSPQEKDDLGAALFKELKAWVNG